MTTHMNIYNKVKAMRRTLCALCLLSVLCAGCERMTDENGDLDGMWQLTEWRDKSTNKIVKTNEDHIYYNVQLDLIKFQEYNKNTYYLSHFAVTSDSLLISAPYYWPGDQQRPMSEVSKFGVPANVHFHIDALTNSRMQLSTDVAVLTFRKY